MSEDTIHIADAPVIAGLSFRHYRGEIDSPQMTAVLVASENADGFTRQVTPEFLNEAYKQLINCDPYQDMIIAEIAGEMIGYARGQWRDETSTERLYILSGFLVRGWRGQGIGKSMLNWIENCMRKVAISHPIEVTKFFQVDVAQSQQDKARLLEHSGYKTIRYFVHMVRPTLDDIPDWPLPAGVELRPVSPGHYLALWESIQEISQDEWGYTEPTEEAYQAWLNDPDFQPQLWQVAWDIASNRIAGHVLTYINEEENTQFDRKRGYTEGIGVVRGWRKQGLARSMISHSLRALKAAGMSESALVVDRQNPSNALQLYESCGFQLENWNAIYRKQFSL